MSGGHFGYSQHRIDEIASEVEDLINNNTNLEENEWGEKRGYFFSDETIQEFREGFDLLRKAAIFAQRIDWLVSGDDSEETFHERLQDDLMGLSSSRNKDKLMPLLGKRVDAVIDITSKDTVRTVLGYDRASNSFVTEDGWVVVDANLVEED